MVLVVAVRYLGLVESGRVGMELENQILRICQRIESNNKTSS